MLGRRHHPHHAPRASEVAGRGWRDAAWPAADLCAAPGTVLVERGAGGWGLGLTRGANSETFARTVHPSIVSNCQKRSPACKSNIYRYFL